MSLQTATHGWAFGGRSVPRFLDANQIVTELGLYGSRWGVLRAARKGEIPPGKLYGRRLLWDREELLNQHRGTIVIKRRAKP